MRRPIRKRDLQARIERLEKALGTPLPAPLPGQQTIPLPTIGHHVYEGSGGDCEAEFFAIPCGQPRDAHHHP